MPVMAWDCTRNVLEAVSILGVAVSRTIESSSPIIILGDKGGVKGVSDLIAPDSMHNGSDIDTRRMASEEMGSDAERGTNIDKGARIILLRI